MMERLFTPELSPQKYLAQQLIKELAEKQMSITAVEGLSGGRFLDALTIAGSTQVFRIGHIAYSRRSKIALGLPEETINKYGEYSPESALALCKLIQKQTHASLALAVVGSIDPIPGQYALAYLAMAKNGASPWLTPVMHLHRNSRTERKAELTHLILSRTLMYIRNHHQIEKNLDILFNFLPEKNEQQSNMRIFALAEFLKAKKLTISTMESCTGGAIANAFTDIPGASEFFDSTWVAYDENVKKSLGVPLKALVYGNVYSEEVAFAMAKAVMEKTGTDIAIATTGTMENPDTRPFHTDSKPGTVFIAILIKGENPFVTKFILPVTSREMLKAQIVDIVIEILSGRLDIRTHGFNQGFLLG